MVSIVANTMRIVWGGKEVVISLDEKEQRWPAGEIVERLVAPAIHALDNSLFPEKLASQIARAKELRGAAKDV